MRKGSGLAWGAGLGLVTGLAVVAVSYLAEQWAGLPFFPFVLFEWLTRVLPGGIIVLGIGSMVRVIVALGLGPIDVVAKAMEQWMGVALWLALSVVVGVVLAWWLLERRKSTPSAEGAGRQAGVLAGLATALLVVLAMLGLGAFGSGQPWTILWLVILLPGWGAILGTMLERVGMLGKAEPGPMADASAADVPAADATATNVTAETPVATTAMGRRDFILRTVGGSLGVAIAAAGLGWLVAAQKARTGAGQPLGELQVAAAEQPTAAPGVATAPAAAPAASGPTPAPTAAIPPPPAGRPAPAPGVRPEITPTTSFYRIDIDLAPPVVTGSSWQLQVSGLFDHPRNLAWADLLAFPPVNQPITQSCISNPIGGDLISSAYYTGARFRDVLQDLGIQPAAKQVALQGADGFYESVETQDLSDPRVLLVYGMNGESLPVEHGYPLRIYIPNRYGMKQPKWITSMQAIDHEGAGYWVDRGWSKEARPQVISIIDSVAKDAVQDGRVPVGGIAWAGDRGIKSVEVQVDGGQWAPAALRTPPIGPLMWVQWRYDWPVSPGRHTFRVRATDGKGALQIGEEADTYPNGATGYHAVTVNF